MWKSGGQKFDLISLLLNKFSRNFAYHYLLPIQTQARKFWTFWLRNKNLSDQLHVKKCILSLKSYTWLVQFLEQPVLYRLLINIPYMGIYSLLRGKYLTEYFSRDWPIIAKASCLPSSEWTYFRPHGTRGYQKVLSLRHFPHSDSTMLHT